MSIMAPSLAYLFAAFIDRIDFSVDNILCIKYAGDVTIIETLPYNCDFSITVNTYEAVFTNNDLCVNRRNDKKLSACLSQLSMQGNDRPNRFY